VYERVNFKFCWEFKNCDKACPVRATESVFCWRIAREDGPWKRAECDACAYRQKWFGGEFSLQEFILNFDRRKSRRMKKQVVIIDDEPNICFAIEETVRQEGYNSLSTDNGEDALLFIREMLPALVIADVILPKMDGYELCRAIKADSRTSHIPVILVTVRVKKEEIRLGMEAGADAYLLKPFRPKELVDKIGDLIEASPDD
jgi:CheY-like chemotaxis protein